MKPCGGLAVAFLMVSAAQSAAAGLSASFVDRPAIRPEMVRGVKASLQCAKKMLDHNAMDDCIAAADAKARREQVNPSPFLLGLHFRSLILYSEMLDGDTEVAPSNYVAAHAIREDRRDVSRSYAIFAKLQRQVGVTDRQVVGLVFDTEASKASAIAQLKQWAASPPKP